MALSQFAECTYLCMFAEIMSLLTIAEMILKPLMVSRLAIIRELVCLYFCMYVFQTTTRRRDAKDVYI